MWVVTNGVHGTLSVRGRGNWRVRQGRKGARVPRVRRFERPAGQGKARGSRTEMRKDDSVQKEPANWPKAKGAVRQGSGRKGHRKKEALAGPDCQQRRFGGHLLRRKSAEHFGVAIKREGKTGWSARGQPQEVTWCGRQDGATKQVDHFRPTGSHVKEGCAVAAVGGVGAPTLWERGTTVGPTNRAIVF